jgi:hypothetical protein
MPGKIILTVFIVIILLVSTQVIMAGSFPDSLWIESAIVEAGMEYSVSVYVSLTQTFSGFEIPLVASSPDLIFDSVSLEGSIVPSNINTGFQKKASGDSAVIFVFPPSSVENLIEPPGGKLCELYFHVDQYAPSHSITIDTLTYNVLAPIDSSVLVSYPLNGWDAEGAGSLGLAFSSGTIYVAIPVNVDDSEMDSSLPDGFRLYQNRPNPFNSRTIIGYDLPRDCYVLFDILNILGQREMILDEGMKIAGEYFYELEFADFETGFYFYRLQADGHQYFKRMLLLK